MGVVLDYNNVVADTGSKLNELEVLEARWASLTADQRTAIKAEYVAFIDDVIARYESIRTQINEL